MINEIHKWLGTKRGRRVAVAEDALSQLRSEKYLATPGTYVWFPSTLEEDSFVEDEENRQLDAKTELLERNPICEVCAQGALFLSCVRKENNVLVSGLLHTKTMKDTLNSLFGVTISREIEGAFEGFPSGTSWRIKYRDDTVRLEAILKNIIKYGNFKHNKP